MVYRQGPEFSLPILNMYENHSLLRVYVRLLSRELMSRFHQSLEKAIARLTSHRWSK